MNKLCVYGNDYIEGEEELMFLPFCPLFSSNNSCGFLWVKWEIRNSEWH